MWRIGNRRLLVLSAVAVGALAVIACSSGVPQKDYDAAQSQLKATQDGAAALQSQLQAKEVELGQLRAQVATTGQKVTTPPPPAPTVTKEEIEHGQVGPVIQLGQLQPAPAAVPPTGWDTQYSQLLGITLMAKFDSSGPDAWDVKANPHVYVVTDGPGYAGFISKGVTVPGLAIVNADTHKVVITTHYDIKAATDTTSENHGISVSMDGKWIYTQGRFQGRDVLMIINARTLKLDKILASRDHHEMVYHDAATNKDLVLIDGWGIFFALDPNDDHRVVAAVDPADLKGNGYMGFVDPAGKELWISVRTGFSSEGGIAIVSLKTWKVTSRINTQDSSPIYVAFSHDGKYGYVTGGHDSTIAKIDRGAGTVLAVSRTGTEGPWGDTLSYDEKTLFAIGKGEGSTNQGMTVGIVDATGMRPTGAVYTGCLREDHAIINPWATNEMWISCNSSFESVVFDMVKKTVTARIPMPDGGSNHSGAFVEYAPDWTGHLLSNMDGLQGTALAAQNAAIAAAAAK